jgi:hypothetical protein
MASPFHLLAETLIGRGTKAINPGGAGAKPGKVPALQPTAAPNAGRPLIMRALACWQQLRSSQAISDR